jgi:hypothetical protein
VDKVVKIVKKRKKPDHRMVLFCSFLLTCSCVAAEVSVDLDDSLWSRASVEGSSPILLYALALQESRLLSKGLAKPDPLIIRKGSKVYRYVDYQDAVRGLSELVGDGDEKTLRSIDVGILQVNLYWHGHKVEEYTDLLVPAHNIWIGSQILAEALKSSKTNTTIGVGRYHSWTEELATNYGSSVIRMACAMGWDNMECKL